MPHVSANSHLEPEDKAHAERLPSSVIVTLGLVTFFIRNPEQAKQVAKAFEETATMFGPAPVYASSQAPTSAYTGSDDDVPF